MESLLLQAAIYLGAGVIAVPIAQRLGLGSVLGYLLAGIAIAPLLDWIGSDRESIQHFAEFGVVLMLFLVGLELQPRLLWDMRTRLLGLGGLQVLLTTFAVSAGGLAFGLDWRVALAVGMIFSLSSTAIVLQSLGEKGWLKTDGGQSAFSVLLFQDVAVIPMLAILPLLAVTGGGAEAGHAAELAADGHGPSTSLVSQLPGWGQALTTLGAVALVVLAGRYLTRPAFRIIARTGQRELFSAGALLIIILIALLMGFVGLSPALGTFLAGVVLAESEYRHELVSDLEPFKGLLLGVFFITVGAGIQFSVLAAAPAMILGLTAALIATKALILWGLARAFGLRLRDRWMFTFCLAQTGEFAFLLLGYAAGVHVLPPEIVQTAGIVVALSMLATPILMIVFERVVAPLVTQSVNEEPAEADDIDETGAVIIAGMGRFGQIVQRLLLMTGHRLVVLDHSAEHIAGLRKFGIQVYYGDALRPDLLEAAGVAEAKLFIVTIGNRERAVELVSFVKRRYPHVRVIARAASREHVYQLTAAGADSAVRELFGSSLEVATQALTELGYSRQTAERKAKSFADHDTESLHHLMAVWDSEMNVFDNDAYIEQARSRAVDLADLMSQDAGENTEDGEDAVESGVKD
jgi:CPA2 family monovalent cation:H+ antiporter-2